MRFSRYGGWSKSYDKGMRSGLEESIAEQLKNAGIKVSYENFKIKYVLPNPEHTYTPDFVLPNGIIIEAKGYFQAKDRVKHKAIKKQYPHLDIRFIFSRSTNKLNKKSKTTYAAWCKKNGFLYADKYIPDSWLKEPKKENQLGLIKKEEKKGGKKKNGR